MDRYKFRGRRVDNGEWAYGYYLYYKLSNRHYILTYDWQPNHSFLGKSSVSYLQGSHEVQPDTVGMYTDKQDMDGKEVYYGDIVFIDNVILNKINLNWLGDPSIVVKEMINHCQVSWDYFKTAGKVTGTIHDKD